MDEKKIMGVGEIIAAIVGFIRIEPKLEALFAQLVAKWMEMQTQETLSGIADAAALGARAQTDADRYAASQAWQKAFQRPRVTGP